jgi:hypothetical protein
MIDLEEGFVRRSSGAKILLVSLAIGIAGVAPLLLYIAFGPRDGNPIGLGLLAVVAVPVAGIGIVLGAIKLIVERIAQARR